MSVLVRPGSAPVGAPPAPRSARRRSLLPYLLLAPGLLWLLVFFAVPMVQLVATSLYDPSGSLERGYQMTLHWQNYVDA
ncbi:MAG: ABC transporter permease, partial [Actinomycetota bacterium]